MSLTAEQITAGLRRAAEAVEAARLPNELRTIGFERALDALGLGEAQMAPAPSVPATARPVPARDTGEPVVHLLDAIARRFELPAETIGRIYEADDGAVRLAIKRSMLPEPDRRAAAMRDVSLLVVAGRQAAGEEQTPFVDIREECRALNVLDGANFSSEVAKLDFRVRGARNTRTAKANRHHYEEAAQLIRRMLGESGS